MGDLTFSECGNVRIAGRYLGCYPFFFFSQEWPVGTLEIKNFGLSVLTPRKTLRLWGKKVEKIQNSKTK